MSWKCDFWCSVEHYAAVYDKKTWQSWKSHGLFTSFSVHTFNAFLRNFYKVFLKITHTHTYTRERIQPHICNCKRLCSICECEWEWECDCHYILSILARERNGLELFQHFSSHFAFLSSIKISVKRYADIINWFHIYSSNEQSESL